MTNTQLADELKQIRQSLDAQEPRPLSLPEAASYMSISRSRLYFLTSQNLISHFKPTGKKIYFKKSDLDSFLLRNRVSTRQELAESRT